MPRGDGFLLQVRLAPARMVRVVLGRLRDRHVQQLLQVLSAGLLF